MTLKEALQILLNVEHIGDFVYNIRERVGEDPNHNGSSWNHPRVRAYSEAVRTLQRELAR